MKKTDLEIEALKRAWVRDSIFDLEDAEGFEEHRAELLAFSENKKAEWKDAAEKHHAELASKICPLRNNIFKGISYQEQYEDLTCLVELCAWWNEAEDCCAIRALNLRGG